MVALFKPTGRKGVYAVMAKSCWREQIDIDWPSINWKPQAITGRKFWSSLCIAEVRIVSLPSFITKLLCFWKGLLGRVASCSHRRLEPQAHDAESKDVKINYPTSSQLRLWPAEGCLRCLGHQFAGSGWRVKSRQAVGQGRFLQRQAPSWEQGSKRFM